VDESQPFSMSTQFYEDRFLSWNSRRLPVFFPLILSVCLPCHAGATPSKMLRNCVFPPFTFAHLLLRVPFHLFLPIGIPRLLTERDLTPFPSLIGPSSSHPAGRVRFSSFTSTDKTKIRFALYSQTDRSFSELPRTRTMFSRFLPPPPS